MARCRISSSSGIPRSATPDSSLAVYQPMQGRESPPPTIKPFSHPRWHLCIRDSQGRIARSTAMRPPVSSLEETSLLTTSGTNVSVPAEKEASKFTEPFRDRPALCVSEM